VYGVATFYNQFRFSPPGQCQIQVCRGTACHVKGSASVLETVARLIGIKAGETTRDGMFSLEVVACMGACGLSPLICCGGDFHAGVSPQQAEKVINSYRQKAAKHGTI
jgi:NADH-quinone oxidoreductase subunit E